MTPANLRAAGEALYGPRWQSELARALGVSDRTMRRWLAGTFAMPDAIASELQALIKARAASMKQISKGLGQ